MVTHCAICIDLAGPQAGTMYPIAIVGTVSISLQEGQNRSRSLTTPMYLLFARAYRTLAWQIPARTVGWIMRYISASEIS